MAIINSPSLANCQFLEFGRQVNELVEGGASWFHIDIMDGHYVPNLCFPVKLVGELKENYPEIKADVHLMVTDPIAYIPQLKENRADYISFHLDSTPFSRRVLDLIHQNGMKGGVVINPSQSISSVIPVLDYVDYVVVMTVEPGYAGQRFMSGSMQRIEELVLLREARGLDFLISVDGGIDYSHARECARLGVEVYVTGNFTIFKQQESLLLACRKFKEEMEEAHSGKI
ncbi:Pentose-5-phosphate-3-epimerase [Sphaerochaeta pleomorpha str. Grapes]|uniref:Pentose-5-phosphate-3-epimerase n=1 Tax=Sphaerochaeta pleomorpha (strain ATCC BAA-1885 / DSM 22778 / Grapes) TaxID=158190 RepID=G8QUK4_SPHPG|nr:ribulose-phosphate 3-epimerase [Sphaerochaeta pleomorpha]AEV29237.1 Pentose-5-phosphate-3-epimerase [Sphaerochaeta pleomorpha str. Grapes]